MVLKNFLDFPNSVKFNFFMTLRKAMFKKLSITCSLFFGSITFTFLIVILKLPLETSNRSCRGGAREKILEFVKTGFLMLSEIWEAAFKRSSRCFVLSGGRLGLNLTE